MEYYYDSYRSYGNIERRSLVDQFGYQRGYLDQYGNLSGSRFDSGLRYDNGYLYDGYYTKVGYADPYGNIYNNLGSHTGYYFR